MKRKIINNIRREGLQDPKFFGVHKDLSFKKGICMQFRRRREKKTDYVQRLALLKSGKPRLVVRRAGNNFRVQIIDFTPEGDKTLVEVASSMLKKYGWKGHCGSMPAAYLTGLHAEIISRP